MEEGKDTTQQTGISQPTEGGDGVFLHIEEYAAIHKEATENIESVQTPEAMAEALSKKKSGYEGIFNAGPDADLSDRLEKERDVVAAYYRSDAFRQRSARSLGYESVSDLLHRGSKEDKESYNTMIVRGRSASEVEVEEMPSEHTGKFHSVAVGDDDGTTVIYNPYDYSEDGKSDLLGMSVFAHEMAHHIYTSSDEVDGINPGIHAEERGYGGEEVAYGREGSPLSTINSTPVDDKRARKVYGIVADTVVRKGMVDEEAAQGYLKEESYHLHDEAGMERAADVNGVRFQMMKDGIHNPFSGEEVTPAQVREFKRLHPESRVFEYWSVKQLTYYLNNIAMQQAPAKDVDVNKAILQSLPERPDMARAQEPGRDGVARNGSRRESQPGVSVADMQEKTQMAYAFMSEDLEPSRQEAQSRGFCLG